MANEALRLCLLVVFETKVLFKLFAQKEGA